MFAVYRRALLEQATNLLRLSQHLRDFSRFREPPPTRPGPPRRPPLRPRKGASRRARTARASGKVFCGSPDDNRCNLFLLLPYEPAACWGWVPSAGGIRRRVGSGVARHYWQMDEDEKEAASAGRHQTSITAARPSSHHLSHGRRRAGHRSAHRRIIVTTEQRPGYSSAADSSSSCWLVLVRFGAPTVRPSVVITSRRRSVAAQKRTDWLHEGKLLHTRILTSIPSGTSSRHSNVDWMKREDA